MPVLRSLLGTRAIKDTDVPFDKIVDLTSATATGKLVTASSSLRVATVYAAVRLLAESIGSLPTALVRKEGNRRIVQDNPLAWLLTVAPNPEQDAPEFYRTIMGWMLLDGNAYAYVERNGAGVPIGLWPIPSTQVTVGRTPSRRRYFEFTLTEDDPEFGVPRMVRVGPESMLHYKAFGTGVYGLSPIQQVREAIGTALAAQEYMGRFYQQDASPGGVVKVPGKLSDEQFERLKREWQATHQGVKRSHLLAVLEGGAEWQKVGLNPGDAAFIETQKWEAAEIAKTFGVPPHMIGDVEKSTSWGTGIAEQGIGFVTYTLTPWITRLEWVARHALLSDLDRDLRLKWRVEALQRGDTKARYEGYQIGRNWGWLSANDIRTLEDMDPIDGGDVYLQPLNMVPADTADAPDEADAEQDDTPRGGVRQALDVAADATMVALYPPADVAAQLAVDGGLEADDLHVTLAYLGRDLDADQRATVRQVVASVAAQHQPLAGQLGGGLGQFPAGDDGTPVWAPVDVPGLAELRHRLVEQLDAAGITVASDHGFTPHMTLTYLADGETPPAVPEPLPASFELLTVATGGVRDDHPLTGRRQRHTRGVRSAALRKRLAGRFAPLIADADREVAELEREQVSELVQSHLVDRSRSPAAFAEAVRRLYDGSITDRMLARWLPVFTTLAAEVADDAAEQVAAEPPDLERWVRAYVASHVGYQTARSVAKVVGLSSEPDAADAIRSQLDRWVDERPATTGRWESTQMSRAAAREAWKSAGVRELVWVASSACDLCTPYDGVTVAIERPFFAAGTSVEGAEGQTPLEVFRDTFHPPLHPGCDCDIAPA